ncbi:MAG: hypothetical protein ACPH4D_01505 [Porticoccaceae bacterium]
MSKEYLYEFCTTDRHREVVAAYIEKGSCRGAAKELGCDTRGLNRMIKRLEAKAAAQGLQPERDFIHQTAEGFKTRRMSTAYGPDGDVKLQWHIQERDKGADYAAFVDAIENFTWTPAPKIPHDQSVTPKLLTLYTLTDFHLGMYSWAAETGDSWDMVIAENEAISAIERMAQGSPDSETAILNLQGDFLHWDSLLAVTPASKHVLDADTRYGKLIELALSVTMQCVEILLRKHKKVKLLVCEGNHDESGSAWLRKAAKVIYRDNPRLEVDDTEFPYYAHLHGDIMLGFHHGHKKKNKELPSLFSSEPRYREMWGQAKYCYIHTGHYHHAEQDMSEYGGAIVERHPTLAGNDAYAARGGYVSWRAARAITYHEKHGEYSRKTVVPVLEEEV